MLKAVRSLEAAYLIGVEGVTEVWLVRHADAYEHLEDQVDPPLSARGLEQAARLAERVKRFGPVTVYSSPHRRAVQTARAITDDVREDPLLVEMGLEINDDGAFVFTESPESVAERMGSFVAEVVARHPGERLVVISHAGAILNYLTGVLHLEYGSLRILPYYTSVTVLRVLGDRYMAGAIGDTAHLE